MRVNLEQIYIGLSKHGEKLVMGGSGHGGSVSQTPLVHPVALIPV